jgi:predicted DNA-binding transcriptional regulator AlpA
VYLNHDFVKISKHLKTTWRFIMKHSIHPALQDADKYPNIAHVRLPVVKGLLGVSGATVWRLVKAGKLKTHKLTPRTTTFNMGEIRAFMNGNVEAK